jgi:hypothetical protein
MSRTEASMVVQGPDGRSRNAACPLFIMFEGIVKHASDLWSLDRVREHNGGGAIPVASATLLQPSTPSRRPAS